MYRAEVHVDPPLTDLSQEEHAFVVVEVTSTSRPSLEWFLGSIKDRTVCVFETEETNDE